MSDLEPRLLEPDGAVDGPPLERPRPLPWYAELLMVAHLALTRDGDQHEAWTERVDALRLEEVMPTVSEVDVRRRLRRPGVWRRVRRAGSVGALTMALIALPWNLALLSTYASDLGFGWGVSSLFLLAVPAMWWTARWLFERSAIATLRQESRGARWLTATILTGISGFGAGFVLVFLQGLLTWFMTPAPTFGLELLLDATIAAMAGFVFGMLSMWVTPVVAMAGEVSDSDGADVAGSASEATRAEVASASVPAWAVAEERR